MTGKIGLVGLGLVGTAMAERLLAEGFEVAGFDIDEARCKHLEELGGKAAGSPAEAAQQVNPVILSLPDTQVVLQVVEGPGGFSKRKIRQVILSIRQRQTRTKRRRWHSGFSRRGFIF